MSAGVFSVLIPLRTPERGASMQAKARQGTEATSLQALRSRPLQLPLGQHRLGPASSSGTGGHNECHAGQQICSQSCLSAACCQCGKEAAGDPLLTSVARIRGKKGSGCSAGGGGISCSPESLQACLLSFYGHT